MNAAHRIGRVRLTSREVAACAVLTSLLGAGVIVTGLESWSGDPPVTVVSQSGAAWVGADSVIEHDNLPYVNLNTASVDELVLLPGIGPVRARAIVENRARVGPFPSVDALVRVRGIGQVTVERVRSHVVVRSEPPQ